MTDKNNDAVLYSLQELKDMPEDSRSGRIQANVRPVAKKSNNSFGSDSAGDLLAGILDETAGLAEAEEQRLQAELDAQRRAEEEKKRQEEARKRQDAEARIQEEASRRQQAERKRASMLRAIEGPSDEELEAIRKAEEEEKKRQDMEARLAEAERARQEAERKAADAARQAREREEQRLKALAEGTPEPARKGGAGMAAMAIAAMFFVFVLVLGGGAAAYFLYFQNQGPAAQTYAKVVLKANAVDSPSVEKAFVAIPTAPVEDTATATTGGRNNTRTRKAVGRTGRTAKPRAKTKKPGGKPKFDFSGSGGGGGITF